MLSQFNKDYSALLSNHNWPIVEKKLLRGVRGDMAENLKTVLANTRHALISNTQMQNITYLPKLVLPLVRRLDISK